MVINADPAYVQVPGTNGNADTGYSELIDEYNYVI